MSKGFVDDLIKHMKLACMISKVTSWMVEGRSVDKGENGDKQVNVRFVGLQLKDEWLEIFSERDNVLLKFVIDRNSAFIEYYLANKAPFTKIITRQFSDDDKWEHLLGEVKRRLKKDKSDVVNRTEQVGNIYSRIKPFLK